MNKRNKIDRIKKSPLIPEAVSNKYESDLDYLNIKHEEERNEELQNEMKRLFLEKEILLDQLNLLRP